jgi:hypothetical protein
MHFQKINHKKEHKFHTLLNFSLPCCNNQSNLLTPFFLFLKYLIKNEVQKKNKNFGNFKVANS